MYANLSALVAKRGEFLIPSGFCLKSLTTDIKPPFGHPVGNEPAAKRRAGRGVERQTQPMR